MDGDPRISREEYEAVLAARRELGQDLEAALVDSFVEKVEAAIDVRQAGELTVSERQHKTRSQESNRAMVVAIVSAGVGIPLTAISLSLVGLSALVVVWIGLACINVAIAMGRRRSAD